MIQQLGYNNPGNNGPLGIADSQGGYTYYADYTSALKNAKAGDTIVQFANIIEPRPIVLILKNGVNINMNGFTYTSLLFPTGANNVTPVFLWDGNIAVTCTISNGSFKSSHTSATGVMVYIQNASSNITTNCYFESVSTSFNNFVLLRNVGIWTGGKFYHSGSPAEYSYVNSGRLNNAYLESGVYGVNNGGYVNNCIISGGTVGIGGGGYVSNCVMLGVNGIYINNGGGRFYNCISISITSPAGYLYANGICVNCVFISTASHALSIQYFALHNAFIYSTAAPALGGGGVGGSGIGNLGNTFWNSTLISTTNSVSGYWRTSALNTNAGASSFINCTLDCQWNNPAGHCFVSDNRYGATAGYIVSNCYLKVSNVNAKCLHATLPSPLYFVNNIFQGTQKPVSDNISQQQINTRDLYNNILIG